MIFNFKNLGYIDEAKIELGNLTVIFGKNNTGKTYISYALYSLFNNWQKFIQFNFLKKYFSLFIKKGSVKIDLSNYEKDLIKIIEILGKKYSKNLYNFFSVNEDFFKNVNVSIDLETFKIDFSKPINQKVGFQEKIEIIINKEENDTILTIDTISLNSEWNKIPEFIFHDILNNILGQYFFSNIFSRPYIITSERTGISLFWKELDINKNILIDKILKKKNIKKIDFFELLTDQISRYAEPIKSNIDDVRDIINLTKQKSYILKNKENEKFKYLLNFWTSIINGSYKFTENEIYFIPKKEKNRDKVKIPVYVSSSASKSVLLLDVYIKNVAQKGDILFFDEPELNFHPENQRKIIDLLVQLSNLGIKVFITTHSDYILKELNNLIMMYHSKFKDMIIKKYGYSDLSTLDKNNIKAYIAEKHTLNLIPVDKEGLDTDIFDKTTYLMNEMADDVFYSLD